MFDAKSKYVFGSEAAVDAALKNGLIDAYDVFFLDEAGFGWIDRNGEKVVLKNKKQVSVVDFLPDAGEYEVIYIYNSNMFLWNGVGYTDLSISGKLDETALSDAINTALELAKESGEFNGNDYVLTDDDRNEIAELAAKLVEIPNMEGVRKKLIVPFEQWGHSSYSAVISGQELKDAIESGMDIVLEWNGASYEMVDYHTGLSDENGRFVRAVFEKFYPDTLINEIITIDCHMDSTTGSGTVDIVNVGENLSRGGIDVIGAAAGQTVIISEVDESGAPVSWEPVDFPKDQAQTDWNQTDRTMPDYIKNRPMSMSYVYDIGSVESLAAGEIVKINDLSTAVGGVYEAFKISHMQPEGSRETMVSECNIKIGDNMLPQAPVVLYFEAALDNNNYTMRDGSRFRVYVIMNVNTLTEDYKNLFQTKGVYLEDVGLVTGKYDNITLRMRVYNQLDPRYISSKIARVSEIPQVDNTLSIEGAVADAKAVGDAISQISSDEIYILGDGETTNDAPESAVMVIDPEGYADIPNSGGNANLTIGETTYNGETEVDMTEAVNTLIDSKLDDFEIPESSGGGTSDAIQYTEQTLTEEQQMQARKNLGLYHESMAKLDIVAEQQVTFSGGVANLLGVKDPCYELHLCSDPGSFTAILEVNGENIEGEMRYYYVATGTFNAYNINLGACTITLGDGATVQDGETATVRLCVIAEMVTPLEPKYLPGYVASAISYDQHQGNELTNSEKAMARSNIDALGKDDISIKELWSGEYEIPFINVNGTPTMGSFVPLSENIYEDDHFVVEYYFSGFDGDNHRGRNLITNFGGNGSYVLYSGYFADLEHYGVVVCSAANSELRIDARSNDGTGMIVLTGVHKLKLPIKWD